jgi:starvation-inducible DNA-binding protein
MSTKIALTFAACAWRFDRETSTTDLYRTKNDLPPGIRAQVADLLNQRLADCVDLQTQCKQVHWNVKGPNFIALHKLFDEINEEVEEYVDLPAERVVQVGGVAEGTARVVAERYALEVYVSGIAANATRCEPCSRGLMPARSSQAR